MLPPYARLPVGSRLRTRLVISAAATVGILATVAAGVVVAVDRSEARSASGAAPPRAVSRPRRRTRRRRPNIVLILTDDQRWDTLWSMPVVRRLLVDHGVTFTHA